MRPTLQRVSQRFSAQDTFGVGKDIARTMYLTMATHLLASGGNSNRVRRTRRSVVSIRAEVRSPSPPVARQETVVGLGRAAVFECGRMIDLVSKHTTSAGCAATSSRRHRHRT
jgi:hypothetical protein